MLGQTLFSAVWVLFLLSLGLGCDSLQVLMGALGIPLLELQSNIYKDYGDRVFDCESLCTDNHPPQKDYMYQSYGGNDKK